MGDNMSEDMVMDLNLNLEPLVDQSRPPLIGPRPMLNELETEHVSIEDRIRQLEAAMARARRRQRWRQARNNPEASYMDAIEPSASLRDETLGDNVNGDRDERGRNCKRDVSQLAKALDMDLEVKKNDNRKDSDGDGGSFFDCNICLDMAKDPILTCCGHLFCWACFYQLGYVESNAKECPVCKGEVSDSNITPIYGNGKNSEVLELESGMKIPPRPRACRVESVRQRRFGRGISHIPVSEALQRIRNGLGPIQDIAVIHGLERLRTETNHPMVLQNSEAGGSHQRLFSRVNSESAASLSSISTEVNSQRFFEDVESYINYRMLRRVNAQYLLGDRERDESLITEINPTDTPLENSSSDGGVEIDLTASNPSSSSRRRNGGVSRGLNIESGTSRELRRRRLR